MEIKFYKCNSQQNTVGKTLTNETAMDCKIKQFSSLLDMTLTVQSNEDIFSFNECYIETFHRYYFISDISIQPNHMYTFRITVDVLETYKDDIYKSIFHVVKSDKYNKYYSDIETTKQRSVRKINFDYKFPHTPTIVLVTAKGTRQSN